jgi:hypothetical protein
MKRRDFIRNSSTALALVGLTGSSVRASVVSRPEKIDGTISMRIDKDRLLIETQTLHAVVDKGFITSLKNKSTGEVYILPFDINASAALQLVYRGAETVRVDESKFGKIQINMLSDLRAEVIFHSWDGDGVITFSVDPETGDLVVEPSAYSSRPGVHACRWIIAGLRHDLQLVAPFFQGIKLSFDDTLMRNSLWPWPHFWEAGLAICQGKNDGFWVHTQDTRYRQKSIQVGSEDDPYRLGFDSEAYGPIDNNLSAGGLAWRINVYKGEWMAPAERYRRWLWYAFNLEAEESRREAWIQNIKMAVSWCPTQPAVLDVLSAQVSPECVLLHLPNWRTDAYDENYPTYVADTKGKQFIEKAHSMGFRVMPHFNAVDMDPSHPAYAYVRNFQYRGLDRKEILGWSWHNGRPIGVPESNFSRGEHRDKKVMVKIHPGLSMWRSILGRNIQGAVEDLNLETLFTDVTLTTYNLHNCLVEGMTSTEGMLKLIDSVRLLGRGLVVGGEGLNEITMQGLSFGQVHLFKSWGSSIDGLERTGGCALNQFLFGRLCRTFGYSGLGGNNENQRLRHHMHLEHGAIPTITIESAKEISQPNSTVRDILKKAAES